MKYRYRFMTYLSQFPKLTYSMAGEDALISHLIKHRAEDKHIGFVNIGAAHPILLNDTFSLTRKLRKKNRLRISIAVDPRPDLKWLWRIVRPKDKFINALVSDDPNTDFYFNKFDSHNSSSNLNWARGLSKSDESNSVVEKLRPTITTLKRIYSDSNIFLEGSKEAIYSILIIDVEGFEINVLRSNDWSLHSPDLIVIEICFPGEMGLHDFTLIRLEGCTTHAYLLEKNYYFYGGNGFSQYYLKNE